MQDRCADTFQAAGLAVERASFTRDGISGVNVIGTKAGTRAPDELVIVGAHYDHIVGCAGADDNGSGVAALLGIAKELGARTHDRTVVLACWDQEEAGLLGSEAHVQSLLDRAGADGAGPKVVAAIVFDTMGVRRTEPGSQQVPPGLELVFPHARGFLEGRQGRGDFVGVLANEPAASDADRFVNALARDGVPGLALVLPAPLIGSPAARDLHRSDHANFWVAQLPALMITDTANFRTPTYHCLGAPDTADTVDIAFITAIARAALALIDERGRL